MYPKNDLENWSQFGVEFVDENEKKLIEKSLQDLAKTIAAKVSRASILKAQEQLQKSAENLILKKVNAALNQKITGKKVDEVNA